MGSCGVLCKLKTIQNRTDIIIEGLKNTKTDSYYDSNISKIIYLQIKIKKFLKIKQMNKTSKINNSPLFSENNPTKKKYKYSYDYSQELLIPAMKIGIENIFEKDNFNLFIRNISNDSTNDLSEDPRERYDDKRRKYGKICEAQSSYEGEWKNGKRDGFGVLKFEDKSKFCGIFIDNKANGFGILYNKNKDIYKGEWKDYKTSGAGIYLKKDGTFYKGYWENDRQNGMGYEKWPKGGKFIGEYVNGQKNGIGILKLGNFTKYEGEFKEGIICGIGTFVFGKGWSYSGYWKDNKMNGYGIINYDNNDFFEGNFNQDKKEGFGISYSKNKFFIGIWKNNDLQGNVIIINNEGVIKKQYWEFGKPRKNLPSDTVIFFEKYTEELIKELKILNKKKKI